MAKLVALFLALSALVAFASAQTTIVTTTIEDENPTSQQQQRQCSRQLQQQRLNQCQRYLQQGTQSPYENPSRQEFQECCQELQNIDEQCQCAAVQQVFRDVVRRQQQQQHQHDQQGGWFGAQQVRQLKQMAQNIPNQCNPRMRQRQCQIGSIITTTITEDTYDNPRIPTRQQSFNQCQRYIAQELQGQRSENIQQCCNELETVPAEWQCEALRQVYNQAMQRQQRQQSRQGGRQQEALQVVENLRNECNLQVQQCRIPSAMF